MKQVKNLLLLSRIGKTKHFSGVLQGTEITRNLSSSWPIHPFHTISPPKNSHHESVKGFFSKEKLKTFCKSKSILGGHPDRNIPGVETTTGSLGHGLSIGIGIALSLKIKKRKSKVYIVLGDGEMNEGSVWEGLMSASKHKLDNLVVIVDHNNLQTYGSPEEVAGLSNIKDKMISFGFRVKEVDGHSTKDIKKALKNKKDNSKKPLGLIFRTIKGKGIDFAENQLDWHHKANLDDLTIKNIYNSLNKICPGSISSLSSKLL